MKIRIRVVLLGILGLWAAGFAVAHPRSPVDPATTAPELAALYAPPAEVADEHVLRRGETLSQVLARADLGGADLPSLLLALRQHIDPRRILPNTSILVRRWADGGATRAVEVAVNADSTVRLNLSDLGWTAEMKLTPTRVDTVYVGGRLGPGGSVYAAVVGHPALDMPVREREALVWRLAHIYGWELNFAHDMHPGDTFRLVYEREVRPDGSSRTARILAAEIVNQARVIPATLFDPRGDGGDYFDADGKSLRLAFNRYPVDYPRITSNFNWRRYHPVLKKNRPHLGTDFGTGYGAPIKSTADGVVTFAARDGGYGNLVRIDHGNGYETRYAHLSRFAPNLRRGRRVKQGQLIGYSGDTGLATAPHLHYEMRQHGRAVDPRTVRLPAAPPVPAQHMEAYRQLLRERTTLLAAAALPLPTLAAVPDSLTAD